MTACVPAGERPVSAALELGCRLSPGRYRWAVGLPGDEELVDVEVAGCEPGFAEGKIKSPGPAECLIEA